MKHSTDRILTTHAGRLDGPPEYRAMLMGMMTGKPVDLSAVESMVHTAIVDVLRKQTDAGIDIVSDGDLGKSGFGGIGYYGRRMSGLSTRKLKPGEPAFMALQTGERLEFADFYKELPFMGSPQERAVCSGPIKYIGHEEVGKDLDSYKAALIESGTKPEETFMCVLAPGWLEHFFLNEYYANDEEYLFALADAVKTEYQAVVDAGFVLQIDDPALPDTYDMIVPTPGIDEYRKFAEVRVEALNHALRGLPEDRVRYHICWGSWHGPHTHDLPLQHVVDLMLKITAGAYSLEAANPRHEHEWKIWQDAKLPKGKILIPGVVTHHTNVVEHPGTDCGMGFRVHPQIAWAKLKALAEGARLATQQLW
jgi:5-methyltetrahydropteroyltriglutamate--homocysteine methyltransferase